MRRYVAGWMAVAGLVACARGTGSTTGTDDIIHGQVDTELHDSVVLVVSPGEGGGLATCTGTVVAPNLVLTARHCVSSTDLSSVCNADGTAQSGGTIAKDHAASDLRVFTGMDALSRYASPVGAAEEGVADTKARGRKLIIEPTKTYCDHDLAFILLDRDLDAPVAPLRLDDGPRLGEMLTAVGWGYIETGKRPQQRMVRENIPVKTIGPRVLASGGAGIGEAEFQVGEAFCSGDSGGPAFSASGAIVGVVSRGGNGKSSTSNPAAGCVGTTTVNTYTQLSTKSDLLLAAFTAAGHEPIVETPISEDAGTDAGDESVADAGVDAAPIPVPVVVEPPDAGLTTKIAEAQPTATATGDGGCSSGGRGAGGSGLLVLAALAVSVRRRRDRARRP